MHECEFEWMYLLLVVKKSYSTFKSLMSLLILILNMGSLYNDGYIIREAHFTLLKITLQFLYKKIKPKGSSSLVHLQNTLHIIYNLITSKANY